MRIAVIGAGPVGCYAAALLTKKGFEVDLFDQKDDSEIGCPIQCTGLLTSEIAKYIKIKPDFLVNTFEKIEVIAPNQKRLVVNKKEFLVDRTKFDQYLLDLAIKFGAKFYAGHKLIKVTKNKKNKHNLIFRYDNKLKIISPDLILGADGPQSSLYNYLNPSRRRVYYYGIQALVKGKFNPTAYQTFFGSKVCPGLFAWVVPESKDRARIGLATTKKPAAYFIQLLKQLKIKQSQILEKQGGIIPLFDPQARTHHQNIFLLGDAAGQVKATTLGGIIPGFQEARNLVNSLVKKERYKPRLKSLKLHLSLRKMLNRFSDPDYNRLIKILSTKKSQQIIQQHSRENPKAMLANLLFNEPKLLMFSKHFFNKKN
ncbi:MAG: NAD(P)/FAD-dependent oxidoreductase [Candidatus Woesearchaeota archaeon]